jgi:hypothetical protein
VSHIQWAAGVKQLGCEADHSPATLPRLRIREALPHLSLYIYALIACMWKLYFFRKNTIKMNLQDQEREDVSWIHLGQDTGTSTACHCA